MENSQADCLLEGSHVDQKWPRHSHSVMLRHWLEFPRKSMALTLNAVLDTKCAVVGSYQLLSLQLESKFYLERRSEQHTSVAATGSNITAFLNRGKLKKEFKLKTCFNSNKSHLYLSITLWFSNHFHIHGSSFIIKLFVAQVFKSKHISLRLLCDSVLNFPEGRMTMLGDGYIFLFKSIALLSPLSNWTILKIPFIWIIYTSKFMLEGNLEIA